VLGEILQFESIGFFSSLAEMMYVHLKIGAESCSQQALGLKIL